MFETNASFKSHYNLSGSVYLFDYQCVNQTHCSPISLKLYSGHYKFELWGASGGVDVYSLRYASGAYASGELKLKSTTNFLVYIGGKGTNGVSGQSAKLGGYNGGGNGGFSGAGGGGATDVRLNSFLSSRIIVAAGGGGGERNAGGHGGAFIGLHDKFINSNVEFYIIGYGGTQQNGGQGGVSSFGIGENGTFGQGGNGDKVREGGGGGGGGYYGGGATSYAGSGGGGSSFVSGLEGCDAIQNEDVIKPSGQPVHYSGFSFNPARMIQGNDTMPMFSFNNVLGSFRSGNGAFKLTVFNYSSQQKRIQQIIFGRKLAPLISYFAIPLS